MWVTFISKCPQRIEPSKGKTGQQSLNRMIKQGKAIYVTEFNCMVDNFISNLTNLETLPPHAHIIASMSINQGGLGLQNPRGKAITSYMTSSKRCLQYAFEGVWLGQNKPRPMLPTSITNHYLPIQLMGD
jgi:hypothetical protein